MVRSGSLGPLRLRRLRRFGRDGFPASAEGAGFGRLIGVVGGPGFG
ncbi:hypothetical protein [Leucobacter insecticola]|nr:hypothetical protein [Leucobacter insecticola]